MKSKVIRLNEYQIEILQEILQKTVEYDRFYENKIKDKLFTKEIQKIIIKLQGC